MFLETQGEGSGGLERRPLDRGGGAVGHPRGDRHPGRLLPLPARLCVRRLLHPLPRRFERPRAHRLDPNAPKR